MMDKAAVTARLRQAIHQARHPEDLEGELRAVTHELDEAGAGVWAIDSVLRFMEENPESEFGIPGPLVHFVERFIGAGYEQELLASLVRRPVDHTVWMLNRLINIADAETRARYLSALGAAGEHPGADALTRASVKRFLERQES